MLITSAIVDIPAESRITNALERSSSIFTSGIFLAAIVGIVISPFSGPQALNF